METATMNPRHKEGKVAETIEEQTAKLPSDVFLWSSITFMAVSLGLQLSGSRHRSLFIGQWVAPFLLFGIYNKLVKQLGHDKEDTGKNLNNGASRNKKGLYKNTARLTKTLLKVIVKMTIIKMKRLYNYW